ncbi:MAG TPA: hypothetical protein V6C78_20740 [Crinalium sp.]
MNKATKPAERDKICQKLTDRGIIGHSREIQRFKIAPGGQALLKQDVADLPLTEQQLMVLQACKEKTITPGTLPSKLPALERQDVIQSLVEKGFVKAEKVQIKEVWLTDQGYEYLRDECTLSGTSTISLSLAQNYIAFLRKAAHSASEKTVSSHADTTQSSDAPVASERSQALNKPSDEEIIQLIQRLDEDLGENNYLPIFHLRQKLQPPFSRDELDQALYRLQRNDHLEISALVEAIHYTPEQIQAGIPQESGGPLFFLSVL